MIRILSIGNSFSQDCQAWLHEVCSSVGLDVRCVNLYVGACTLKTHYANLLSARPEYDWEVNGKTSGENGEPVKISLVDALSAEPWDIITFQQASHQSGRAQSYVPYLPTLFSVAKQLCPNAKFYINETWSYAAGSDTPAFAAYGNDPDEMYRRVSDCYEMASRLIGVPLIKVGDAIRYLRTLEEFDPSRGGVNLNRDAIHLSLIYGRYAAALVFAKTLCGVDPKDVSFSPSSLAKPEILELIRKEIAILPV